MEMTTVEKIIVAAILIIMFFLVFGMFTGCSTQPQNKDFDFITDFGDLAGSNNHVKTEALYNRIGYKPVTRRTP